MPDMGRVVGSDSARVHQDTRPWFKRHYGLTCGIEQPDWQVTNPFLFLLGCRVDTRQLRRNPSLVANIQLQKNGGERFDRGRIRELASIKWTTARNLVDDRTDLF